MNSGSTPSPASAGATRWLLKFTLFLLLFAALALALTYAWQTVREPAQPAPAVNVPAASPTPTVTPAAPVSGASGHADRPPSPRP